MIKVASKVDERELSVMRARLRLRLKMIKKEGNGGEEEEEEGGGSHRFCLVRRRSVNDRESLTRCLLASSFACLACLRVCFCFCLCLSFCFLPFYF